MDKHINPQLSFSNIASGGQFRKPNREFTGEDFPALGGPSRQTPTREEILMSNLLGNNTKSAAIGSSIMTPGNMDLSTNQSNSLRPMKNEFDDFKAKSVKHRKKEGTLESADKFGLQGLKQVIRMTNPDLSMLALGCDLTMLGLDLNSNENVYSNFMTPFSDNPSLGSEPRFPSTISYSLGKSVPDALSKFSVFHDETLLYIFYAMPRDVLQEAAAQELYRRKWRFHKEFKLWLTKENCDSEPLMKGPDFERDVYLFFDPSTWTRVTKEWILYYDQIEERCGDLSEQSSLWIKDGGSIFSSPRVDQNYFKKRNSGSAIKS